MTTTERPGHRRTELASFLRSRRERINPEDVGLPIGHRRRTPGLRREEVAQLAGVGVTWYTWLEQGRPIKASVEVLNSVARTLKLDVTEHEHLYRLAEIPEVVELSEDETPLEPSVQTILDHLSPLPASVVSDRYDLLAWNDAYNAIFPGLATAPAHRRNLLWAVFTIPCCCNPFVNRADQVPTMVARFRAAYGRHVGEPAWANFVEDLREASPDFAAMWDTHDVARYDTMVKIFDHPAVGRISVTATGFGVLATPETRMIVYTPVDESSTANIAALLAGTGSKATWPCRGHAIPA